MTYLIDSDWVADWLKGYRRAVALLNKIQPDGLAISAVTYGEIYEGILYGTNRQAHERGFRQFLRGVRVLPISRAVLYRFASIRGDLRARGQLIGDMDLLIASTALTYDLTLVTRNVSHFQRIPALKLYDAGTV